MKQIFISLLLVLTSTTTFAQIVCDGNILLDGECYSTKEYCDAQPSVDAVKDADFVYAFMQNPDSNYLEDGDYHDMYITPNGSYGINSKNTYYEFNSTGFSVHTYINTPTSWKITNYGYHGENAFKLGYKVGYLLADKGDNQYIIVYGKR